MESKHSRNSNNNKSSSVSYNNMLKTGDSFKDKDKRYSDKIKSLKSENKKLVQLLKDSERLFY